jgi:nucleotidyltransferase substrate binding protein (TIGR01987 family)
MSHLERFELARNQYNRALGRLQAVAALHEDDIIRDSLIQRFEFTYELAWKSLFYWLRSQGETVPEMQRPIIQAAFRCELIGDPERWERIKECRDQTSHTYDEDTAVWVAAFVRSHALAEFERLQDTLADL